MAQLTASDIDLAIGKRIQVRRKERGFSADKLSEMLDISQQQLSRYERGENKINVAHLVHLANYLQTPISYFFRDCIDDKDWNTDNLDIHWQKLTRPQKKLFIQFIQTFEDKKRM